MQTIEEWSRRNWWWILYLKTRYRKAKPTAAVLEARGGSWPGCRDCGGCLSIPRSEVVPGGRADDHGTQSPRRFSRHEGCPPDRRSSWALRSAALRSPHRGDDQFSQARPRAPGRRLRFQQPRYIAPCIETLARLEARLGRFAVLGNHDHWESTPATVRALAKANIVRTDNTGFWIEQDGSRLRVCGVGDLWTDSQFPARAGGRGQYRTP